LTWNANFIEIGSKIPHTKLDSMNSKTARAQPISNPGTMESYEIESSEYKAASR